MDLEYRAHNAQSSPERTMHGRGTHNVQMVNSARGSTIDMPPWWRELAGPMILVSDHGPRNSAQLSALGEKLAKKTAFERGHLKNTAQGNALHRYFPSLPHALFIARDQAEGLAMANVQATHDHKHPIDIEQARRDAEQRANEERLAQEARRAGEANRRAAEARRAAKQPKTDGKTTRRRVR